MAHADEHNIRTVIDKYIKQSPGENIKTFEGMEKENMHGTRFFGLWKHERDVIDDITDKGRRKC